MIGNCKWCKRLIKRRGKRKPVFCCLLCKGEWQKTQKPITSKKLFQLYAVEKKGTYQIAKIIKRDPKRVYEWLKGFNIPIRKREWKITSGHQLHHNAEWLKTEYLAKKRSAAEIALELGVTENNIFFFLKRFEIPRRKMEEIRAEKYWGAGGSKNPMYGRSGKNHPNWQGGLTPERQAFYSSLEWRRAYRLVWKRDKSICQRCGIQAGSGIEIHVHHKVSFMNRELRAELSNLVLLCRNCHLFVHSSKNIQREFIILCEVNELGL